MECEHATPERHSCWERGLKLAGRPIQFGGRQHSRSRWRDPRARCRPMSCEIGLGSAGGPPDQRAAPRARSQLQLLTWKLQGEAGGGRLALAACGLESTSTHEAAAHRTTPQLFHGRHRSTLQASTDSWGAPPAAAERALGLVRRSCSSNVPGSHNRCPVACIGTSPCLARHRARTPRVEQCATSKITLITTPWSPFLCLHLYL